MAQPHNPFTDSLERWKNEQATLWAQLKYRLVAANLALHLPPGPFQMLDAGGGNGVEALAFAHAGHEVTLVDSSAAMLAEARSVAAALDLSGHLRAVEFDLAALPERREHSRRGLSASVFGGEDGVLTNKNVALA